MSNQQRRGGGPNASVECECPLASLGNTQSLDTQPYHHPLSSSPLDPQAYINLDSNNSGLLTTRSTGNNSNKEHSNNDIVGGHMYPLSRSSSSSLDQNTPSYLPPPRRGEYRPMRPRTYTPIDSLLASAAYNHQRQSRLSPIIGQHSQRATPNSYAHRVSSNERHTADVNRYFLEEKMDALYIQGAIRNSPAAALLRNSDSNNQSDSTERYYLENENIDNIYHYYPQHTNSNHILDSQSPNILRRASSPSSGSDRYLIDRIRSSPSVNPSYNNRLTEIRSPDHMLNSRNVMNSR